MRHNVCGRKLNRTKSHRDAMFANMVTSLFEHKKLYTTEAKAKELRPFAETLITKAKIALAKEKQKLLPVGQTIDIHSRRLVARYIRNKAVLQELFDAIAPTVETRQGGYCRVIKTGTRRGDAARTAIIELVDWAAPVDGATSLKKKKKRSTPKSKPTASPKEAEINKPAELKQPTTEPVAEVVEQPSADTTVVENVEATGSEVVDNVATETEQSTEETSEENTADNNPPEEKIL